jgi:glyoxylase-like metal-dependent hydrolase (beta-lactamase superfamily II)
MAHRGRFQFLILHTWAVASSLALSSTASLGRTPVEHWSGAGTQIVHTEVAPGVHQFMTLRDSYVRQLNSVAIVTDQGVLVFDTNTRPSTARLILAEIRKRTDQPVRFVVNSHWHPEHARR